MVDNIINFDNAGTINKDNIKNIDSLSVKSIKIDQNLS